MGSVVDSVGGFAEDLTGINLSSNSSSDKALRAQQGAAADANRIQKQMYDQTRSDLSQYRDAGGTALSSLAGGKFMDNWQQDPGYQFRMAQGMNAIQGSAAVKGALNSGATLKALTRYGQDFGSGEYANVYNREFGRLSQLANLGQNAATQTGAAAQNYGNAYANNVTGAANAQAAQATAQAGQMSGLVGAGLQAGAYMYGKK